MSNRIFNFFTSLRLTVACLVMALILVFAGTLAQVNLGLYLAQENYFQSIFVYWSPAGADWKVPVWPGGYLLGGVLLINLIAAHVKRFTFNKKKAGIFLIHAGLILLLLGQFLTELLQVESAMRLDEGQTKNYSESFRKNELAVVETSHPDYNQVVAIPEKLLHQKELEHEQIPFKISIKEFWPNSLLLMRPGAAVSTTKGETYTGDIIRETETELVLKIFDKDMRRERQISIPKNEIQARTNSKPVPATKGFGSNIHLLPLGVTYAMDTRNVPSAILELETPEGSLGSWLVSCQTEADADQFVTVGDRKFTLDLRFTRYYKPYYVQLLDFRHDRYQGTNIPKNFSSKVQVHHPGTGENREVLIYMNNPLRYEGETYYQGGFDGETTSILQVVRNPAWLTPYLSVIIISAGLLVQFLSHLIGFLNRRKA